MIQRYCLPGAPMVEQPRLIKYSEGNCVLYADYKDEIREMNIRCEKLEKALRIIATDLEYPCEIMDLEGKDGPCQCTCCKWARLGKEALSV